MVLGCLMASSVWAVAPTLSINESAQGSDTFLKTYATEGITLSSTASFSSGSVQLGNTPNSYDQHYIEVLATNNPIDSISYLISGNGSNKSIQAPVFGWTETATSSTADTYRILDAVTVAANSYASAQWFTYDFHNANVKCLRIYRSSKNISSVSPAYTGSSTALGSGQTIKVYGLKIWLKPAGSVAVTGVTLNKTTTSLEVGQTETLTATIAPSNATNQNMSWTSNNTSVATVDQNGVVTAVSAGQATITVTTADGNKTAICTVTVTAPSTDPVAVTGVTLNKTSTSIKVGATETLTATIEPSNATNKGLSWTSSAPAIASVNNGVVTGVAEGNATITVTTTDGNKTATCTVTVTPANPVPQTDLDLHEPGVYEAKSIDGGYATPLPVVGKREYEVFYAGRWDNGGTKLTIHVDPVDKSQGVTKNETNTSYDAIDGWFTGNGNDKGSGFSASEEFNKSTERCHTLKSTNSIEMHIKGYDQFSLYGMDKKVDTSKPTNNKVFTVSVDNVAQTMAYSTSNTIRRFDISTGEHVIKITCGDDCLFGGFSLRVAQEPRIKHLKGNDSTQTVLATTAPKAVYYYTKYNSLPGALTELKWVGDTATGITLTKRPSAAGAIGDTLVLGGTANCPAGTYLYRVVSSLNGVETSSVSGKLTVYNKITAMTGTTMSVYQGEEMDEIRFSYYTLSANDVTLTWQNQAPAGITGSANNGKFTISGTPTAIGTYPFSISVPGCEAITGTIQVNPLDLGNNPIMYLFKNDSAYNKDGVYKYLKSQGKNLIVRKTKDELRAADQYKQYKWILISEDVDADNPEVLAIARGEAKLPVLNMKGFSYTSDRLNWGEPNNGTLDSIQNHRYKIFVQRAEHPIFQELQWKQGDSIEILSQVDRKGLMPIGVNYENTLCLATAYTRGKEYYEDGQLQTILHEVPATMHGGKKYLCLPLALSSSNYLTDNGKKLLKAAINYLTNDQATVALPTLEITKFMVGDAAATIDQLNNTITLELDERKHPDLTTLHPVVTLADPKHTFVTPTATDSVDFQSSNFAPVEYIVSDYINRRVYDVTIRHNQLQSIEDVYTTGQWVNIFDIYGRLVTTTNENIYTLSLPHGMYLVVTGTGETIKLMR